VSGPYVRVAARLRIPRRPSRIALLALFGAVLPAACTVGPNYRAPHVPVPPQFAARSVVSAARAQSRPGALSSWWQRFHDAQLSALIARALRGNLDLQAAATRVRVARTQLALANADRLPVINAAADVDALHLSQNSGLSQFASLFGNGSGSGSGSGLGLPGNNITTYTIGFDASWEIDLFGGVRRAIQAAQASAEQAVWTQRDSEVSIAAEVANDYWRLRSLQGQIGVARAEVQQQRQMLSLLQARQRFGFVTEGDVRAQAAQLEQTRAILPDLDSAREAQVHALGVLVGESPGALQSELAADKSLPALPHTIPVGLPSDLLRRRPDIRAAERALAASSARIGVAVDALYPKISLTGALDLVSIDLKHLLDIASRQYSAAGALSWPLFQGKRGTLRVRIAEEQNRQALLAYQSTVLQALREVDDALTRYGNERRKNRDLRQAVSDAQTAEQVARQRFRMGLYNIERVLRAEGIVLQTRMQLAQSNGMLDSDLVALYKALGGGWRPG
jgi:outer membrane protein, multidrug efflux system